MNNLLGAEFWSWVGDVATIGGVVGFVALVVGWVLSPRLRREVKRNWDMLWMVVRRADRKLDEQAAQLDRILKRLDMPLSMPGGAAQVSEVVATAQAEAETDTRMARALAGC